MTAYGYCHCGCGEKTKVSPHTDRHNGWVGGEPRRFVNGHYARTRKLALAPPNPSGLCRCGCGEGTPIAAYTHSDRGWVEGEPISYIHGHNGRPEDDWEIDPGTGCWLWQRRTQAGGYGETTFEGRRNRLAHRVVYERLRGPVPEDHHLHHVCGTRVCVNPDHLVPLTPAEHAATHAAVA